MGGKNANAAEASGSALNTSSNGSKVPTSSESRLPCKSHWIGLRVEDEAGQVVRNVRVSLKLTDGSDLDLDLASMKAPEKGACRTGKVLPAGDCEIRFPDTYDIEWWPNGEKPSAADDSQQFAASDGDCALSLAATNGFRDYHSVWDHAKNKDLKTKRPNANALVPGDVLVAPGKKEKSCKRAVDKDWTFVVKNAKPAKLRLVLIDKDDKPISGAAWQIKKPIAANGSSNSKGLIEITDFPPDAAAVSVEVTMPPVKRTPAAKAAASPPASPPPYPPPVDASQFKDPAPVEPASGGDVVTWELSPGGLFSFNDPQGVEARLHNLGFGCDIASDAAVTARAVKAYQRLYLKQPKGSGKTKDIEADIQTRHDAAP